MRVDRKYPRGDQNVHYTVFENHRCKRNRTEHEFAVDTNSNGGNTRDVKISVIDQFLLRDDGATW